VLTPTKAIVPLRSMQKNPKNREDLGYGYVLKRAEIRDI